MRGILRAMIFMMMKPMKSYCLICMNKIISIRKKKKKEIRQNINDRVRVQRKNPWMNESGIKRQSKKKRAFRNDNSQKVIQSTTAIPEEVRVYEFSAKSEFESS